MQPRPVRQHRVDERSGQVDPPPGGAQHPLDELGDLCGGEDERGQFRAAAAGDEDPAWLVDPDLLDRRVVEERLQRPEPGDRVDGGAGGGVRIVHRREGGGADAVLVLGDHLADDLGHRARIAGRVDAAPAHQLAGPRVDDVLRRLHAKPPHPPDRTKHLLCGSVVPNLAWRASGFQPAVDGRLAGKVARSCRGVFISREAPLMISVGIFDISKWEGNH